MVDVPLSTIPIAPPTQSGTLSNGVAWSVDYGEWLTGTSGGSASHYTFRGGTEVQTWTFNVPVNVTFGITGLQGAFEGVLLPPGATCVPPSSRFTWDATTRVLQHVNANTPTDGSVVIPCTVPNVTSASLSGRDTSGNPIGPAGNRRGPNYVRVERVAAPMSAVFTNVPPTLLPNRTVRPTLTCTNAGPGAALAATCVPSVTAGGATVANVVCTPSTPVAVLNAGTSISCEFDLTAPAGPAAIALQGDAAGGYGPNATATTTANSAVLVAPMQVAIGGIPATMAPGATASGTVTCTNSGPGATTASTCELAALPAGSGTVSNFTCTPASPAPLAAGAAITCTFDYAAPATAPAGPVTLEATAAGGSGPNATATTTHQVTVSAAPAGVQAVPTLQTWALMLMGALVAGLAGWRGRRAA